MSPWKLGATDNAQLQRGHRQTSQVHAQVPSRGHDVTCTSLLTHRFKSQLITLLSFTLKWHSYDTTHLDEDHDSEKLFTLASNFFFFVLLITHALSFPPQLVAFFLACFLAMVVDTLIQPILSSRVSFSPRCDVPMVSPRLQTRPNSISPLCRNHFLLTPRARKLGCEYRRDVFFFLTAVKKPEVRPVHSNGSAAQGSHSDGDCIGLHTP